VFFKWILTKGAKNTPAVRSADPVPRASKARLSHPPTVLNEKPEPVFVRCYWRRSLAKVALVTGSSKRRVGWHVANALAAQGYALAIH